MLRLPKSLQTWGSTEFDEVFKQELCQLATDQLPLQHGLTYGSYPSDKPVTVTILNVSDETAILRVKAGIFFTSIIAGCQCADDPSPQDELNEYCEMEFAIAKDSGLASITLLAD